MNNPRASGPRPTFILMLMAIGAAALQGCTEPPDDGTPDPPAAQWSQAFDATQAGALSGVWGTGPSDVFVVGGTPAQGEAYHYDGSRWRTMTVPAVSLLVWVYGFAADDVLAVGLDGGVVHYNGTAWTTLDSGTDQDLWGVWGAARDDVWIVGGDVGSGAPVILHYDGSQFESIEAPANDRSATSLFKVWGIAGRVFAVGENGLILSLTDGAWAQVPAGAEANDDFVSLWGTRGDLIVSVGGRATGRIATFDGSAWTTVRRSEVPGLNAVFMVDDTYAAVGGALGYVGALNPMTGELVAEESGTQLDVHAMWGDGAGRTYAVGGQFRDPYRGVALVRTTDGSTVTPELPDAPAPGPAAVTECPPGETLVAGQCTLERPCTGADADGDTWPDACDNCAGVPNLLQRDKDEDGVGNVCDRCPGHPDDVDSDGDGVADGCDVCATGDDRLDADRDGTPDACDVCAGDDGADADADGVPDACDVCAGGDDTSDADADGVPDACDICAGGDDDRDGDADGVPDACDICAGHDDLRDADGDGTPDGCDECLSVDDADADGVPDDCDVCPGFDDALDTDDDGVADGCDRCPGAPDSADADGDGAPDACDACPGSNDNQDADGDGVPDGCDVCAAGDDGIDGDADGVADACDACAGADDGLDADGDTVPDGCDVCPGFDDRVDDDDNGIPDGCCAAEADCPVGSNCVAGVCAAATGADLEINFGGQFGCLQGPLLPARDLDRLVLCEGNQGFADLFMTLRMTGFSPGVPVSISYFFELDDSPCTAGGAECPDVFWLECVNAHCSLFNGATVVPQEEEGSGGVVQVPSTTSLFFLDTPFPYDGRSGTLRVRVEELGGDSTAVERTVHMVVFASARCFDDMCPEGQTCVDHGVDKFCLPQ